MKIDKIICLDLLDEVLFSLRDIDDSLNLRKEISGAAIPNLYEKINEAKHIVEKRWLAHLN